MNQAVHEKQKAISRQFIKIADDVARRLGLETRLHKLNIENLDNPECEIGLYTSTSMLIGVIDVRLNVANREAKVTSALFRDLEDAVDNWTFDVSCESRQEPDKDEDPRPPKSVRLRCDNPNCLSRPWEPGEIRRGTPLGLNCPDCGRPGDQIQESGA